MIEAKHIIPETTIHTATLAGGCYWCLEAIFSQLKGVKTVLSGFSGGDTDNPSYEDVCKGTTGHAEVIHFDYDVAIIDYTRLLTVFFSIHDPTTLNRQGHDVGSQYRSAIFYHNAQQKAVAEKMIESLTEQGIWKNIVTQVTPFKKIYPATREHQAYFKHHPENSYCQLVVAPKIKKAMALFAKDLQ